MVRKHKLSIIDDVPASTISVRDQVVKFSVLLFRSPVAGQLMVNSLLTITIRELDDFGLYSCTVRNVSSDFCLHNPSKTT